MLIERVRAVVVGVHGYRAGCREGEHPAWPRCGRAGIHHREWSWWDSFRHRLNARRSNMPLNIDALAPRARERYLAIGRRYLTAAVLAQANKILRGLEKYAAQLARSGFGPRDAERLRDGRDALLAHEIGRSQTATTRKVISQSNVTVEQEARDARHGTRAVLGTAGDEALELGNEDMAKRLDAVLTQTRVQPDAEVQLLDQLETLYAALSDAGVLPLIADRGGPETLAELVTARGSLTTMVEQRADSTADPAAADARDIVDGYVVTLARRARAAANVAARRLGQPAIAEAFKLTHLRSRAGSGATPDEPAGDEPTTEPTEPVTPANPATPAA
jgi:hypothetical protein